MGSIEQPDRRVAPPRRPQRFGLRLAAPQGVLALLATLLFPGDALAVGDSAPLDFQEQDLEAELRLQVSRAPKGRLLWVKADPRLLHGPYVRSPTSLWVGRASSATSSSSHAELVELDDQGRELRIHALHNPWGPAPVFGALGTIHGYVQGRHPVAWTPSGDEAWRGGYFREARFFSPDARGGVFVAGAYGQLVRLDAKGRQVFSVHLGSALAGPPLVLGGGRTVSCLASNGTLVALDGAGKPLFRDEQAQCTAAPALAPAGTLVAATEGGLRLYDPKGQRLRSLAVAGRLGSPLLAADGSIYVATSFGRVVRISPEGRVLWAFPLGRAGPAPSLQSYPGGGLAVSSAAGHVLALDAKGKLLWSFPLPSPAPMAWVRLDGAVLVLSPGDGLRLVAPPPRPGR